MTTNPVDLESLRGHTEGPWEWRHNELGKRVALITPDRGRLVVMDLARSGMQGAEPRFAHWNGIERGEARGRQGGILQAGTDHVDARLIAAAPNLLAELTDRRARDAKVAELVRSAELAVRNIKTALRIEDDIELGTIRQLGDAQRSLAAALAAFKEPTL